MSLKPKRYSEKLLKNNSFIINLKNAYEVKVRLTITKEEIDSSDFCKLK